MSTRHRMIAIAAAMASIIASCSGSEDVTADAGTDFSVAIGESPSFDGCASGGDIVNYRWVVRSTPANMVSDVDKTLRETDTTCTFTLQNAMIADEVGEWEVELIVTDDAGIQDTDTVVIRVVE